MGCMAPGQPPAASRQQPCVSYVTDLVLWSLLPLRRTCFPQLVRRGGVALLWRGRHERVRRNVSVSVGDSSLEVFLVAVLCR